ncbi:hypothetical protein KSC_107950 [Ktedonobacter sp. SOSP1-52]|nr:hypothetical protein KSC_107950 [Ktedonobacter sp. SOSP1-52]
MLANHTQNGITTAADAQIASYSCSCLSSQDESKLAESVLQPDGTLGMRVAQLWKLFSENLLRAGALFAEEAAHMNDEMDRATSRWKIV